MFDKFLSGNFKLLQNSIASGENVSVFGLGLGEKLALVEDSAFLFYVVPSMDGITPIVDKLSALGRTCGVLTQYITPLSDEFDNSQKILEVASQVASGKINTLVLTADVMLGWFPKKDKLKGLEVQVGSQINLTGVIGDLVDMNYTRVDLVSEPCQFAVRGDIIDIYPLGQTPTRIETGFDEVESIKIYNPVTMLTTSALDSLTINSNAFVTFDKSKVDEFFLSHKLKFDDTYDRLCTANNFGNLAFDVDSYTNVFGLATGTIVFDGARDVYNQLATAVDEYNAKIKDSKSPLNIIFADCKTTVKDCLKFADNQLVSYQVITESNRLFTSQKVFSIRTLPSMNYYSYNDGLVMDVKNYLSQNYTIFLCVGSTENLPKYRDIFERQNIKFVEIKAMGLGAKSSLNLLAKNYPLDVILPEEKLAIISTPSLLGVKKKPENIKCDFFDGELPKAGDFVVHNFHGVGKCLGVETLSLSNSPRDYVVIEYKGADKLFLPVENIDQISKYLGSDKEPTLNKIGGVEFAKTKSKVKSAVKKIAYDLIALYKERLDKKGVVYPPDDKLQMDFENAFTHTETVDQLNAINDCKKDMESGKIMDRLVCGDVGFGKTEVALRIAFKTIMAGKQVAFLCPTTILSEQHYNNAKARLADFGVKVDVLNRLKSDKEVTAILQNLKDGRTDMIIGTHKLLGKDVMFKNLGLLILDEEQKFGVADKDKIKNLKKNINVLTLSATPIPRTLNLSLIGVRDISVIETPPIERISSQVQVVEYSNELIKKAIDFELSRGGQVLIIYNRVETIYRFASMVAGLVPDSVVSVAHGQMSAQELEQEIYKLYSGVTRVLVATTLIENGVDLPNANTLIVINSDLLGLSQLYQLKGRIGRSDKQSYAYFTFDNRKMLTENGYKRLQAIQEFSGMGSGFKIAMRDLEIRGAGSVLGLEQSGHIEKIGYNMYVQLLSDSIKELNGQTVKTLSDVRVETNIPAYLSHDYVQSSAMRMKLYREISAIDSADKFVEFIKNTESVYGDIPSELVSLAKIGYIKNMCAKLGATRVIIKDKSSIILADKENLTKDLVTGTMDNYSSNVNFNFAGAPTIEIKNVDRSQILDFLIGYLQFVTCNC